MEDIAGFHYAKSIISPHKYLKKEIKNKNRKQHTTSFEFKTQAPLNGQHILLPTCAYLFRNEKITLTIVYINVFYFGRNSILALNIKITICLV